MMIIIWYLSAIIVAYKISSYFYRRAKISNNAQRYVLITGCDSGFGRATAIKLDKLGLNVFAACFTHDGTTQIESLCSSRCRAFQLDISNSQSIKKGFEFVKQNLPQDIGLWGLINNSGILGKIGPPEWSSMDDYRQVIGVNLLGTIDVTLTFLPLIKKAKGRIVSTTSMVARLVDPSVAPYGISKYGIEAFSDALRRQMALFGVSVHIVQPAGHRTGITNFRLNVTGLQDSWEKLPKDLQDEYGSQYLQQYEKILHELQDNSYVITDSLDPVVDAYEHALLAVHPKVRYLIGLSATWFVWPLSLLPEWAADMILHAASPLMKITPKALQNSDKLNDAFKKEDFL